MSKKVFAGLGVAAALGVAILPTIGTSAVGTTTYIKATVDSFVGCTSTNDTSANALDLGNITAGTTGSETFKVSGSTNDPSGFTLTGTATNLTGPEEAIPYSAASVAAETAGWYVTSEGAGFSKSGNNITLASASLTDKRSNEWTLTANVSTATTTTKGNYSGSIAWECVANNQ